MAPEASAGEAGVVIPLSEVYREVREMHGETKEIRGETAQLRDAITALREAITNELKPIGDHETRIRSLERKVWIFAGVAAGAGAGLSQLANTLMGG